MSAEGRDQPLVTVCVPTTGRPGYLELALQSAARQTYRHREILILDNASPPPAQEVLRAFVAENPDARILRVDERVPMFANFNRGIAAAAGEYVVFFHDDDVYDPGFLEAYVDFLERHPEAGFAGGCFDVIDGEGQLIRHEYPVRTEQVWDGRRFSEDLVRRGRGRICTPGLVFRRSILQASGFPEDISLHGGDYNMQMRLAEDCGVGMVVERLFQYRHHDSNASGIPLSTAIPLRTEVLLRYCEDLRARRPQERAFVERLERHIWKTQTRDLFAGWLSAPDEEEGEACRERLAKTAPKTAKLLRGLQRLGLTSRRRRPIFPWIRNIAKKLGV